MLLKQSTAQTVVIGPILDSAGAAVTTAVVTNISIAKNGSAAALTTETLTHLANGYYTLALTTSNTNTLGILAAYVNNTAMSMTVFRWNVIVASAYDAIVNNATNATGGLLTATGSVSAIAGALLNTTNLPTNFASLAITAGGAVTAGTVSDKTGYALSASGLASITSWTVAITGNITGNLSGSVGSVTSGVTVSTNNDKTGYSLTQSFPANFAALGINASGHVSRVTLVDTTTTNTDMRGTDNAALASNWTATRAGYLDGVLIAANYNQRTVAVTGSNHVAADIHELQAGVISSGDFAAGAIDATVLATDAITSSQIAASAVTEIQAGLATSSQAVAIKAVTDKLDTAVVLDGAVYQFTANALELGPSGNATVIVSPLSATQPETVIGTRIPRAVGDVSPISVDIYDSNDAAVNLTTLGNLEVCVETEANVDLQVVAHANLTISGASNNKVTWTPNAASVATVAKHRWSLRVASNKKDIAHGVFEVLRVALSDV